MSDLKPTISCTSVNSENMSRHQMLDWVNKMVNGNFKKIEELSSGVAYCQMMEMIFPNCINIKRVKMLAKLEHESFHNMKLLQGALTRLKLDKTIPVDRLIKARFQDNFEFLQWFKKFFDSQAPGMENMKSAENIVPIRPRMVQKDATADLRATMDELSKKTNTVMETRDTAYNKLRQIEILLTETINKNEHVAFCNRICEVLYKTDQDDGINSQNEDNGLPFGAEDVNGGMY